jgi:hypothetical protein
MTVRPCGRLMPNMDRPGFEARRRDRYGLLLILITVAFVVLGTGTGDLSEAIVTALLGVIVMLALWAAERPSPVVRRTAVAIFVGVAAVVVSLIVGQGHTAQGVARAADAFLVALAPPVIVIGLASSLRRHGAVTVETVLGALCVYLLAGMLFAFVYGAMDRLGGDPFFAQGGEATSTKCIYFSYTTLTTVGYGDLTARSNLGHTLAVAEALLGQLYLVTVVSVGVANIAPRRRRED